MLDELAHHRATPRTPLDAETGRPAWGRRVSDAPTDAARPPERTRSSQLVHMRRLAAPELGASLPAIGFEPPPWRAERPQVVRLGAAERRRSTPVWGRGLAALVTYLALRMGGKR